VKEKNASSFIHRIGKVVTSGSQKEGFSTALVLEPERGAKQAKGSLFFILDIAGGDPVVASEIGRTLMEVFEEAFYAKLEEGFDDSFERGLKAVNEELKNIAEEGERSWIGKLFGIIAATSGKKLLLSHRGTCEAYLLRSGKMNHLTAGLYAPGESPRPESTFVHVVEGDLKVGDKLLISTAELFYYFSIEKLRKLLEDHSPAQVTQLIGEELKSEQEIGRTNLLLMEFTLPELLAIEDLEEEAESEQIIPIKTKAKVPPKTPKEPTPAPLAAKKASRLDRKQVQEATNFLVFAGRILFQVLRWIGLVLLTILDWLVGFLTVQIARIKKRKGGNRILLGIGAALVVLIILLSVSLGSQGGTSARLANKALEQALSKQDAAKAALIYEDQEQATSLLLEAYDLLQTASKNKRFEEEANKQLSEVGKQLDRLNNINRLELKTPLTDFAELKSQLVATGGQETVKVKEFFFLGGDIYAFDDENNKIYKYGSRAKEAAVINSLVSQERKLSYGTVFQDDILFYTNPPALYTLEISSNKLTPQTLADATSFNNATGIETFGSTLYLLDPQNNQIWRYRYQTGEGNYIQIAPYFAQEKPNLQGATSLAIDGNIYLLVDGVVKKYLSGAEVPFSLESPPRPTPSLGKASDLFVNNTTASLYLLDSINKRVLVFDKEGNYRSQYIFSGVDNPETLWVDEGEKVIFLKEGTKIYQFKL